MKTTKEFIDESINKHGLIYDYSLVDYRGSNKKVDIICRVDGHGVFDQLANNHLQGQGCPECSNIYNSVNKKDTKDVFIQKSINKHGGKYDYSLVEYKNSKTKVKIICPEHGVFEQTPSGHIRGRCCFKCSLDKRRHNRHHLRSNSIEFDLKSTDLHGGKYDYSLVDYKKSTKKVKIICPEHGVFEQRPNNHLQGQGCPECITPYNTSKSEIELQEWLSQYIDIKSNDRSVISPFELDIVIPSKKIAIEYNGLYWHSEQQGKDKRYHLNKYNLCKDKGYRLIHIFEDEWLHKQDIVKSRLKHILGIRNRVIYARKCKVKEIDPRTARLFIDKHHIQGYTGSRIKVGLYYKEELVAVMTFSKPSISKGNKTQKDVYELSRYCSSCAVTGGAGKLLKYFTRNYKINGLFTYADLRWSDGNLYKTLGFVNERITPVNYYYIIDGIRKHRYNYRKNVLKDKLDIFSPNETEYQNMLNNGFDRIWDCGNLKFEYIV